MNKQMTLTNLDYLSGDYRIANLGVTYYLLDASKLTTGVLDLDKAIQNFNANLGIDTGITRIQVENYLASAIRYHAAIVSFKKIYDRRNYAVQGISEFKDMQYIRPGDLFLESIEIPSRPYTFEDISMDVVNMSNAKWVNEYLKHYNKIKLPFSLYAIVNQLFGALYHSGNTKGNTYFEFFPHGFSSGFRDGKELDHLAGTLTTRYEVNPFFDSFLEFVGFSNIQTEELLLESSGTRPAVVEDPDVEWALENTVFNRRNNSNNMFVRFSTPDSLLEGLPAMLNLPLEELSSIITLDMMDVRWGGQAVLEDRQWKTRISINASGSPLGWGGTMERKDWVDLAEEDIDLVTRLITIDQGGTLLDYHAINAFNVYSPTCYVTNYPDGTKSLHFAANKSHRTERYKSYGGGAVYRLNFDSNVVTMLKNVLCFGEENFPTVYVPIQRVNDVGSTE